MSLLSLALKNDFALVAADTVGVAPNGARVETTKILALPHISSALSIRGSCLFYATLCNSVLLLDRGFDELADCFPELLPHVFQQTVQNASTLGLDPTSITSADVLLVGWSEREGRMLAWLHEQRELEAGFVVTKVETGWAAPWPPKSTLRADDLLTVAGMRRLAREQIAVMRETEPERATGGRLMVAQVRRDSVQLVMAGAL